MSPTTEQAAFTRAKTSKNGSLRSATPFMAFSQGLVSQADVQQDKFGWAALQS